MGDGSGPSRDTIGDAGLPRVTNVAVVNFSGSTPGRSTGFLDVADPCIARRSLRHCAPSSSASSPDLPSTTTSGARSATTSRHATTGGVKRPPTRRRPPFSPLLPRNAASASATSPPDSGSSSSRLARRRRDSTRAASGRRCSLRPRRSAFSVAPDVLGRLRCGVAPRGGRDGGGPRGRHSRGDRYRQQRRREGGPRCDYAILPVEDANVDHIRSSPRRHLVRRRTAAAATHGSQDCAQ